MLLALGRPEQALQPQAAGLVPEQAQVLVLLREQEPALAPSVAEPERSELALEAV